MAISYSFWQPSVWKSTLSKLIEQIDLHFEAIITDDTTTYSSSHIECLEHDLTLIGFCIRRLIEKRLITDKLAGKTINIRAFEKKKGSNRKPFISHMGGHVYESYNFSKALKMSLKYRQISDEIIHSTQLMIVDNDEILPDGFLIASDWHQDKRLLHFTIEDLKALVNDVLNDHVVITSDVWDPNTGKVTATRQHSMSDEKTDEGHNEQ